MAEQVVKTIDPGHVVNLSIIYEDLLWLKYQLGKRIDTHNGIEDPAVAASRLNILDKINVAIDDVKSVEDDFTCYCYDIQHLVDLAKKHHKGISITLSKDHKRFYGEVFGPGKLGNLKIFSCDSYGEWYRRMSTHLESLD